MATTGWSLASQERFQDRAIQPNEPITITDVGVFLLLSSNKQQATSNKQQATSNKQQATSNASVECMATGCVIATSQDVCTYTLAGTNLEELQCLAGHATQKQDGDQHDDQRRCDNHLGISVGLAFRDGKVIDRQREGNSATQTGKPHHHLMRYWQLLRISTSKVDQECDWKDIDRSANQTEHLLIAHQSIGR
jgi:hypothetical protein